jgi:hypothetical protein
LVGAAANDERLAAQRGIAQLLDGAEEGVEVEVKNDALSYE